MTRRLFAGLGFVVMAGLAAWAQDAEIGGIERVYLRDGPGADRPVLGVLDSGDRVHIVGSEGSWIKVETGDGRVGFVYRRYVRTPGEAGSPEKAQEDRAIAAAPAANESVPEDTGSATPTPAPLETGATDEISAEIASLRGEIADLKQKIQERSSESYATRGDEAAGPSGPPAASAAGPIGLGAHAVRDQNAGVLVVALFALLVGWVLGSAFTRRRSRSQRPRLRL